VILGSLIDTDALLHAAVYAFVGVAVFIGAFAVAIYARDRAAGDGESIRDRAVAWNALMGVALVGCLGVLAVGIWAMTQKPS
jgi:hypothetical protein